MIALECLVLHVFVWVSSSDSSDFIIRAVFLLASHHSLLTLHPLKVTVFFLFELNVLLSVPVLSQGLWTVIRTSGSRSQDSLTSTFMSGMLKTSANIFLFNSL